MYSYNKGLYPIVIIYLYIVVCILYDSSGYSDMMMVGDGDGGVGLV